MKVSKKKNSTDHFNLKPKTNVKMVPPDGGWGWVVVLGNVIIMILASFPVFGYSILFSPIMLEHGASKTKIAWIFNFYFLVICYSSLFFGPICAELGYRKVALFGGITIFVSMILSTFTPSAEFLFFSFGLLGGIGTCSTTLICSLIIPKYFRKHLGLANGITASGTPLSSFISPLMTNYLLQNFGYRGGSLILTGIVLNMCVGAMLYQPVEWHMKLAKTEHTTGKLLDEYVINESQKSEDTYNKAIEMKSSEDVSRRDTSFTLSTDEEDQSKINDYISQRNEDKNNRTDTEKAIKSRNILIRVLKATYKNSMSLKYMTVQLISWSLCGITLGYLNFLMWIPFVITEAGYSLEMAAWCSSLASIGNFIARIVMTVIADRKFFNVRYGYIFGMFLVGSSIIVFSLVRDVKLYILALCIWGVGIGICYSLQITCITKVVGVEMLPGVLGVSSLIVGPTVIIVGTLTGVLRDAGTDYRYSLWVLAGCTFLSFFMWLLIPYAEKYDRKKRLRKEKKQDDTT